MKNEREENKKFIKGKWGKYCKTKFMYIISRKVRNCTKKLWDFPEFF